MTQISELELFRDVSPQKVASLLAPCSVRKVVVGETILSPGEENHCLYLVLSGRLDVRLDNPDAQSDFHILPGEVVGEMSIIENRLVSAWVIVQEPGELIVVPESLFWEKIVPDPAIMRNLLRLLTNRMRRSNQVLMEAQEKRLRYEQLQKELDTAGKIQANILPETRSLLLWLVRIVRLVIHPRRRRSAAVGC